MGGRGGSRSLRQRPTVRVGFGLVLLLPLHAPVLEPYFDLALCEAEGVGDLYPSPPGEVAVEVELLLQLQGLVAGVGCALAFGLAIGVDGT